MTRRNIVLSAGLLLGLAGCGDGVKLELVPVVGTVTLDGKPLADAVVRFEPDGGGAAGSTDSSGTTNVDGMFVLATPLKGSGAVVGKHKVTIRSVPPVTEVADVTRDDNYLKTQNQPKEKLPDKYNNKSTLMFEVPPKGSSSANFALLSK